MDKEKRNLIISSLGICIFIGAITYVTIRYYSTIVEILNSPDTFREYLNSFGNTSTLVFIGMQILQVIIAAIPGEVIQLAGGYIYGTFYGTLISCVGILIGSIVAFCFTRLLGYKVLKKFLSEKSFQKFEFLMNTNKYEIAMFILFLIPGFPKDILTYFAGVTPIDPLRFFVISFVGRFPGIFVSSYIGSHIGKGSYIQVIIASIIVAVFVIFSVLYKEKIVEKLREKKHPN